MLFVTYFIYLYLKLGEVSVIAFSTILGVRRLVVTNEKLVETQKAMIPDNIEVVICTVILLK